MITLSASRNYIIVKNKKELDEAKKCDLCCHIIWEENNVIRVWDIEFGKWVMRKYVIFDKAIEADNTVSGLKAYQAFYSYCGKEEVERMKTLLRPIPMWESYEQMHYINVDYVGKKLYQDIYVFDANSSFTYGALQLPDGFDIFKEYMLGLYNEKESATNKITRSKFKNLQNFLIGYFTRVKQLIAVRSEIIRESNNNIMSHMGYIRKRGGTCFLSNTDSIVTDSKGAEIMFPLLGDKAGDFKLEQQSDRMFYLSPNIYQIGDKVKHSGVRYFARKHTDFFTDKIASQSGSLIVGSEFQFNLEHAEYNKICKVSFGEIEVTVTNKIGEVLDKIYYKIGD